MQNEQLLYDTVSATFSSIAGSVITLIFDIFPMQGVVPQYAYIDFLSTFIYRYESKEKISVSLY